MSNEFEKIPYYDLLLEASAGRLPNTIGRQEELSRMLRVITRRFNRHLILCSPSGAGKTSLIFALAHELSRMQNLLNIGMVMPDSSFLARLASLHNSTYIDAFSTIEKSILVLDGFGELVGNSQQTAANWSAMLKPLMEKSDISVIVTIQPDELAWLQVNRSHFVKRFEIINVPPTNEADLEAILKNTALSIIPPYITIEKDSINAIMEWCSRFPSLGHQPKAGIELLDEAVAQLKLSKAPTPLNRDMIARVVSSKTGVPVSQLNANEVSLVSELPAKIKARVIGQDEAVDKITQVVQRAKLGLRSSAKPLGSFLALGPSGVGKTETAKALADLVYGDKRAFLRIDMSEFAQEHTVARLLGAPAGYVGFEAGGQLIKHLQEHPYSLILLDEIEKAHPKIFDIFLQILDDGRITSAQGEVVDATSAIIIATSNLAVSHITQAVEAGADVSSDEFIREAILPEVLQFLRPEFVNRFDAITIFKPLSMSTLLDIALKEIREIEYRFKEKAVQFDIPLEVLKEQIQRVYDPRFGARPIKRLIEQVCETALTNELLYEN